MKLVQKKIKKLTIVFWFSNFLCQCVVDSQDAATTCY